MRKCESCGKPYTESKDVFCPHCGAVAATKCTHGSSFDSSRWDRGEIYTKNDSNTYRPGVEPHAQRTQASQGDVGANLPQPSVKGFDFETVKKLSGIIVPVLIFIVFVTVVFNGFSENDYDYDTGYETIYDEYYGGDIALNAGSAFVKVLPDGSGWFSFAVELSEVGFEEFYTESAEEISRSLMTEAHYTEISASPLGSGVTQLTAEELEEALLYSQGFSNDGDSGYGGEYSFGAACFEIGETVYLSDFVLYGEYYSLYVDLPFDAFSCDENGNVTYYRAELSGDGTALVECEPRQDISHCPITVSFENGQIYIDEELTADISEVLTEVVSVNAD